MWNKFSTDDESFSGDKKCFEIYSVNLIGAEDFGEDRVTGDIGLLDSISGLSLEDLKLARLLPIESFDDSSDFILRENRLEERFLL
mgnify:CR=1 FL=1